MMRFLLLLSIVAAAHAANFAMEGEEFSLTCLANYVEGREVLYWLLHGKGTAFETDQTYSDVSVDADGKLTFKSVSVEHEGNHLCVTRREGTVEGAMVNMRVRPLPPSDLWNEVYKSQFITGLVAALVCAFIFTAGCLVFRFRYREPKAALINGDMEEGGHHNPALDLETESHSDSTKM